jgi:hypothetical protein
MTQQPISHHYLPQFYLKEFNFEFNQKRKIYRLYTYDKLFQQTVTPKTTKEICCEKHRNTVEIDGQKDFFIEKLYSDLERIMADFFRETNAIIKCNATKKIKYFLFKKEKPKSYIMSLTKVMEIPFFYKLFNYFVSVFYWRLTIHDEHFKLNSNESYISRSIKNLVRKTEHIDSELSPVGDVIREAQNNIPLMSMLGDDDNSMKIYKNLIFPLRGVLTDKNSQFNLYQIHTPSLNIVGSDAPFICRNRSVGLDEQFIFTWSPNLVFLNTRKCEKITILNIKAWIFKLSIINYLQAKRYVFCNDKETLENVIKYSNMRYGNQHADEIKNELWALLKDRGCD